MTDEIDNNFSLSKANRTALRREMNHKIVKRNQMLNQLSQWSYLLNLIFNLIW